MSRGSSPLDEQTVDPFFGDARIQERVFLLKRQLTPIYLWIAERVREEEIVVTDILVVGAHVLAPALVVVAQIPGGRGHGGDGSVQEVRGATHESIRCFRPEIEETPTRPRILIGPRHEERIRDLLAGLSADVCDVVAIPRIVLHVIEPRDFAHRTGEGRLVHEVRDATPAYPDICLPTLDRLEVLLSSTHGR